MKLMQHLSNFTVSPGQIAICWLGQAGFFIKDAEGNTFAVDPYLTNCGDRIRGFKRLSPMLIAPEEFCVDYYVTTHIHFDHFDYDAVPIVAENNPNVLFFGPDSCIALMREAQIEKDRCHVLNRGDYYSDENVRICAVTADHGTMVPDAIGVFLEFGGHRLYFSGDTSYREDTFHQIAQLAPDVSFLSVNGEFGNMTSAEGAAAAAVIGGRYSVPCHFWTFAEHRGDPEQFCQMVREKKAGTPFLFRQGEICVLNESGRLLRMDEEVVYESTSLYAARGN